MRWCTFSTLRQLNSVRLGLSPSIARCLVLCFSSLPCLICEICVICGSMTGILLFAHGSPVEEANRGVRELAAKIEAAGPYSLRARRVSGWRRSPTFPPGSALAAEAGHRTPHRHSLFPHRRPAPAPRFAQADRGRARETPNLKIAVGQSLEGHPLMPSIILSRVQEVRVPAGSRARPAQNSKSGPCLATRAGFSVPKTER